MSAVLATSRSLRRSDRRKCPFRLSKDEGDSLMFGSEIRLAEAVRR